MKRIALAVLGLLLLLTTLPGGPEAAAAATRTQTLRLALSDSDPAALDSAMATDVSSLFVLTQVMEGLVRPGPDGSIRQGSGAARSWTVSPDGLTYTFSLKPGLTWSDGRPLTAADFTEAWLRALDPQVSSGYSYLLYPIRGAVQWTVLDPGGPEFARRSSELRNQVGIAAPDATTIVVTLHSPTPYLPSLLALPIFLPQRADLLGGSEYGAKPLAMAFNGPFVVSGAAPGAWRLTPNPRYWDKANVRLEQIDLSFIGDEPDAIARYDQGQLDMVKLFDSTAAAYKGRADFHAEPRDTLYYLSLNTTDPFLKNRNIRQALSLALDRQALTDSHYPGAATPAAGLVAPGIHIGGVSYRAAVGDLLPPRADPEAARTAWAAGLRELELKEPPHLELLTLAGKHYASPSEAIKQQLEQTLPGLKVDIVTTDFRTRQNRVVNGDYMMAYLGWVADYDDPATFMELLRTFDPFNGTGWHSYAFDDLVDAAGLDPHLTPVHRLVKYAEAEQILMDQLPVIPLLHPSSSSLRKPYVQGVLSLPLAPWIDLKNAWIVP